MARGWESKAVEEQVEEAVRAESAPAKTNPLPEYDELTYKREGLRLIRSSVMEQLERARSVAQRQMLHETLRAIDQEISALN